MTRKTVLLLCVLGAAATLILIFYRNQQKTSLFTPVANQDETTKQTSPSETFIEYNDPSGFSFSYPDNLTLEKNEIEDNSTYTDLKLSAKEVNGSLNLVISDSKFASLSDWLKKNALTAVSKEVSLGNLKALEVKTNDRLLLGALDQGVLFTIEVPLIEQNFWMKVYNKILNELTFAPPQGEAVGSSSDGVSFEGEEVVE